MLTNAIEAIERALLKLEPQRSARLINLSPPWAVEKIRRARFQRTLRLAAERSPFYRLQFTQRNIDVARISILHNWVTSTRPEKTSGVTAPRRF